MRVVLIVVAIVITLYVVWLVRKPLEWIFIAGFLAIALTGPVNFIGRFMPRRLAIVATYLGLILIPVLLLAIIVPPIVREATDLAQKAPHINDVQDYVNNNERLRKLDDDYGVVKEDQAGGPEAAEPDRGRGERARQRRRRPRQLDLRPGHDPDPQHLPRVQRADMDAKTHRHAARGAPRAP